VDLTRTPGLSFWEQLEADDSFETLTLFGDDPVGVANALLTALAATGRSETFRWFTTGSDADEVQTGVSPVAGPVDRADLDDLGDRHVVLVAVPRPAPSLDRVRAALAPLTPGVHPAGVWRVLAASPEWVVVRFCDGCGVWALQAHSSAAVIGELSGLVQAT
jgi:hypothetical protein